MLSALSTSSRWAASERAGALLAERTPSKALPPPLRGHKSICLQGKAETKSPVVAIGQRGTSKTAVNLISQQAWNCKQRWAIWPWKLGEKRKATLNPDCLPLVFAHAVRAWPHSQLTLGGKKWDKNLLKMIISTSGCCRNSPLHS